MFLYWFTQERTISIHAPSRERRCNHTLYRLSCLFQSTLPHGSDVVPLESITTLDGISIHAPSRERPKSPFWMRSTEQFQSTLPHGSDPTKYSCLRIASDFNPRSLTGATLRPCHAPLSSSNFNPRSLTGATYGLF